MKKFKAVVSEKCFYEIELEAETKEEAEDIIWDFQIDYTKGKRCDTDPEYDEEEKMWIEKIEEIKEI